MMLAALVMIAVISPFLLAVSMLLGIAPLIIPRLLARKMGVFRKQYSKTMVLLFGVLMVYEGKLTMGYLITAQSLANFVISPGRMVSDAYAKFKASKAVKEKLEGILNEETDQSQITEPEDAVNILIKNLSFTYPGTTLPVLKNISLSLSKHQKIALIGSSGSGKSTLGKLLCGYFDTYEGSIEGDGRKLKRMMMIPQSPYVFSDTIYENLCLGEVFSI